jgi:starch-binding outer membrane protein, SusD/RagB family
MKKLLYLMLSIFILLNTACNKDFLEVQSPSQLDEDFIFTSPSEAYKALVGNYDIWRTADSGMFYDTEIVGSDSECHPEAYSAQTRHIPEGLFAAELSINETNPKDFFGNAYKIISRSNIMIEAIGAKKEYQDAVDADKITEWTQLYGEAVAFRANMYQYLIKYFGDVPYFDIPVRDLAQLETTGLTSRDEIYDKEIAALKKVEPLMYRIGEGGLTAERFTRSFVQGLIGKMALAAGGYQTRRTDFDYGAVTFEQKGTVYWNAKYVRRTDYKTYIAIAKEYLQKLVDNSGTAHLITSDERTGNFNNPFQRHFQHIMDLQVSPESIFETGTTRGVGVSEFPYAFGRPSGGGGSNAFPCKSYGQSRLYASFYYGEFDPKDIRRDVTVAVTANSGAASEKLIDFSPGSREKGGLANNKLDESRMKDPYTAAQRSSGCNWVQMRLGDVILNLSYAYALLEDEPNAKLYLTKVRSRAFSSADQATKVTNYVNGLSGQTLIDGILEERKLELAGEGHTRWDMILSGKMPERIKKIRDRQIAMINGLKTNGYYTFPETGLTISNYIWTKAVNMTSFGIPTMLTGNANVDESNPNYPVLTPGWRGNCDKWTAATYNAGNGYTASSGNRNIAIKGLFRYINPTGSEALTLQSAGYVKTNWGINIVNNESQYSTDIFKGYQDNYYTAGYPPRYIRALTYETIAQSKGNITQGYGHASN